MNNNKNREKTPAKSRFPLISLFITSMLLMLTAMLLPQGSAVQYAVGFDGMTLFFVAMLKNFRKKAALEQEKKAAAPDVKRAEGNLVPEGSNKSMKEKKRTAMNRSIQSLSHHPEEEDKSFILFDLAELWSDKKFVSRLEESRSDLFAVKNLFREKSIVIPASESRGKIVSLGYSYGCPNDDGTRSSHHTYIAFSRGQFYFLETETPVRHVDPDRFEHCCQLIYAKPMSWQEARAREVGAALYQADQDMERGGKEEEEAMQRRGFQRINGDWQYCKDYKVDKLRDSSRCELRVSTTADIF